MDPVDFVLEAMPLEVCPQHDPEQLKSYLFVASMFDGEASQPPKWVELDARASVEPSPAAQRFEAQAIKAVRCHAFRLRVLDVQQPAEAGAVEVRGLRLLVEAPAAGRTAPIGGGRCTGSGGQPELEDCGPGCAFDGSAETRWSDADGRSSSRERSQGDGAVESHAHDLAASAPALCAGSLGVRAGGRLRPAGCPRRAVGSAPPWPAAAPRPREQRRQRRDAVERRRWARHRQRGVVGVRAH
jgi:hypothetical protein